MRIAIKTFGKSVVDSNQSDSFGLREAKLRKAHWIIVGTVPELKQLAQDATRRSMIHHVAAPFLWERVLAGCSKLGVALDQIIFRETICGKTLGERVVEAEDSASCRVLQAHLPDGIYAEGRVEKRNNALFLLSGQADTFTRFH